MIDILKQEIEGLKTREEKFNHLKELLQILILKIIYDTGYFKNIIFSGGTALRILFNLKRFSEDIDFSLVNKTGYQLHKFSSHLLKHLINYGLNTEIKINNRKIVHQLDIKFAEILFDMKISAFPGQKLFIRIEIDTNPPEGGNMEISLVNKFTIFSITHFDLPSMYSTKLHACFFRKYVKGRDFYDLLWYLTNKIEPNYILLNNAIKQTHKKEYKMITKNNFLGVLLEMIEKIDFKIVHKDVERFLEDKKQLKFLNKDTMINLIKKTYTTEIS